MPIDYCYFNTKPGIFKGENNFNNIHGFGNNEINTWEYNGDWLNGKPDTTISNRDATLTFILGRDNRTVTYIGRFKEGHMDGSGVLSDEQKNYEYSGEFSNSKMDGKGRLNTKDSIYDGHFKNGKKMDMEDWKQNQLLVV